MSLDNPEFDLLAAFKARFGFGDNETASVATTDVLESAEHIYHNAIDVFIDRQGTENAARILQELMKRQSYSANKWSQHELHPTVSEFGEEGMINFIFTMDLLNFSFWSDEGEPEKQYCIEYRSRKWKGYWSLVAAIRRGLDEGIPVTDPHWWASDDELDGCTLEALQRLFRSETKESMPSIQERYEVLKEAGRVLYENHNCSPLNLIQSAENSAVSLVNKLAAEFRSFQDQSRFEERKVRFLKRAQILAADLWASGAQSFCDIDKLTAFADYRIPQMLFALGVLSYSPPLDKAVRSGSVIERDSSWEIQIRGCSIHAVELLRREMHSISRNETRPIPTEEGSKQGTLSTLSKDHGTGMTQQAEMSDPQAPNAVLIDFLLWDTVKELEANASCQEDDSSEQPSNTVNPTGLQPVTIPHHRTRSIFY